jgi:hypothetical protein
MATKAHQNLIVKTRETKMVVTLFGMGKIWIVGRDMEWVWHVGIFGLLTCS